MCVREREREREGQRERVVRCMTDDAGGVGRVGGGGEDGRRTGE